MAPGDHVRLIKLWTCCQWAGQTTKHTVMSSLSPPHTILISPQVLPLCSGSSVIAANPSRWRYETAWSRSSIKSPLWQYDRDTVRTRIWRQQATGMTPYYPGSPPSAPGFEAIVWICRCFCIQSPQFHVIMEQVALECSWWLCASTFLEISHSYWTLC